MIPSYFKIEILAKLSLRMTLGLKGLSIQHTAKFFPFRFRNICTFSWVTKVSETISETSFLFLRKWYHSYRISSFKSSELTFVEDTEYLQQK